MDERTAFLEGMSRVNGPVTIVTAAGDDGPAGMTVSAMCSVSADPPSVLVCGQRDVPATTAIEIAGAFNVNVLATDDQYLSDVFGDRTDVKEPERFSVGQWETGANGAPRLSTAIAVFECRLERRETWHSHEVLIGVVEQTHLSDSKPPLAYVLRRYATPSLL